MQIGDVIREYRKKRNITQKQMAERLGVTAPAVNKWETGNSYPDITLLAPIARLLGISLDTLLSFQEELTTEEIASLIRKADNMLNRGEEYEKVFSWVKGNIEQYPNCEELTLQLAAVLDGHRIVKGVPDSEKYDAYIRDCYQRVINSKDENRRNLAADLLYSYYLRKENYEKAEEYLAYFSEQNPQKKLKKANIYSRSGRYEEAYKAYEELLFAEYQIVSGAFYNIFNLAAKTQNMEKARRIADKLEKLAGVFEMGAYYEASCGLELAVMEKNADKTLEIMKKMLDGTEEIGGFCSSSLYEHMGFRGVSGDFQKNLKKELLKNFRDEETFGFLKEDKRWRELVG